MALITSQQLTNYYNSFKASNLTFTRDVINATGLQSKQTQFKCLGDHWPCVLYSMLDGTGPYYRKSAQGIS